MSLQFNPFTGTFDVTTKGDTGAVAAAGNGTAAAPGITFASDTNTGIYRPGEDQLALSTGGTGRLFIDSTGKIYCNSLAGSRLEIVNSTNTGGGGENLHSYTAGYYIWGLRNETNSLAIESAFGGNIIFKAKQDGVASSPGAATERLRITSTGQLSHIGAGSSGSPAVAFNGSAPSNSLVIDSSGRAGLGTSSAAYPFHLVGAGNYQARVEAATSTSAANISFGNASGDVYFGTDSSAGTAIGTGTAYARAVWSQGAYPLVFGTNSTRAITIDSSQRVGIGTNSPDARLEVNEQSSGAETFPLYVSNQGTGVGTRASIRFDVANFYYGSIGGGEESGIGSTVVIDAPGSTGLIRFTKNNRGTELARFDSFGRLGIGTTGAQATLHVSNPGASNNGTIWLGSATFYGLIEHDAALTGSNIYTCSTASGGGHIFRRGLTEQMRLDANSRLLVGTSSTFDLNSIFQAASTSNVIAQFYRTGGQEAAVVLGSTTGTLGSPSALSSQSNGMGAIYFRGYDGAAWRNGAEITALADGQTWASGDCPSRLVFSTTADGAASPTERMRIKANGTINFSNVSVYADNAAATAGGLAVGDVYRTSTGQLMIRY